VLADIFEHESAELEVGIGDDGAVIAPQKNSLVLSTDMAVEGTHFNRAWSSLYEIGGKITAANLADIYAMGGEAKYLLVAAAIPKAMTIEELTSLATGIRDEARKVGALVIGGDLTRSETLTIAISVCGSVQTPILRSGAHVGDVVAISELPGKSSLGLELLKQGIKDDRTLAHRYPQVNYKKVQELDRTLVHSLTDVSDGLIEELNAIASGSGVAIELSSSLFGKDIHALHGGEDHVFVGTFSSTPAGWIEIGKVVEGSLVRLDGQVISHQGFMHF
jgi:thiamine-monophosphate kinase